MKIIARITLVLILLGATTYGLLILNNNRSSNGVSSAKVDRQLEQSIDWLLANRSTLYQQHNPVLWWMLREAGQLNGDRRLQHFTQEYIAAFQLNAYDSPWQMLFRPERARQTRLVARDIAALPDYNQYFLFSLSCNAEMSQWPQIKPQHDAHYCSEHHPLAPACITHQMMAYRFQQRTQCNLLPDLDSRIKSLQDIITQQLFYDPRLVDVYMQRVLMLVDSGAAQRVRARSLQRLLSAQLADGSWDRMVGQLFSIGDRAFGFTAGGLALRHQRGDIHTTAQAILLMSHLKAKPELLQQINANQ